MIGLDQIRNAESSIRGVIQKTPMLTSAQLDTVSGNRVFMKGEHLQKTGSFKIRGASNKVLNAVADGAQHIVSASSGNHGQAVAHIAGNSGMKSTIVVPEDCSPSKVAAIEAYGGSIVRCGWTSGERIPEALRIAERTGGVYIPPYDDPDIIAGQGTLGLEILGQVPECDAIFVPVGGGGLISGILSAVKQLNPRVLVIGVEPETADDTKRSLEAGERTAIGRTGTIADGLRTSIPGELTFPIVQAYLDDLITVSDQEIADAVKYLFERAKQVVEPSGAASLAGLISGRHGLLNKNIVTVLSGGNISPDVYSRLLLQK